jgi:DNA-binding MarR family transcriptional regulator
MVANSRNLKTAGSKGGKAAAAPRVVRTDKQPKSEPATGLDRLIHERTRLALVSALAASPLLTFNELKALLDISDGNLSAHARKLEDAGYVDCSKGFDGRLPRTEYRLTAAGRAALQKYIAHMEALIGAVKKL